MLSCNSYLNNVAEKFVLPFAHFVHGVTCIHGFSPFLTAQHTK